MDEHDRRVDYKGIESDWWEKLQNCEWHLARSEHEKASNIADLLALALAMDALEKASGCHHQPQKIRGLDWPSDLFS